MRKALYLAAALLAVPHAASAQFTVINAPDIIFASSVVYFSVTGQNTKCEFFLSVTPDDALNVNGTSFVNEGKLYVVNEKIGLKFDFDIGGGVKSYPKQYTLKVQGSGTIGGEPAAVCTNYNNKNILTTMVTVRAPFSGTIKPRPAIEALMPFSNVTPGGIVVLKGSFGASKGQLLIRLPSKSEVKVLTSQWSATLILATLDSTIQGQLPGSVAFRVVDAAGVTSEWFTANQGSSSILFRPTIAEIVLDPSSVTVNHCSDDAGDNRCNASTSSHENVWSDLADVTIPHPPAGLDTSGTGPAGPSIDCHHASDWGLSSDDDTDTYSVSLKNGWTIEHLDVSKVVMDNGEVDVLQTIPDGATSGQLVVHYHIGASGGTVVYGAFIVVRGPKGVAF